MSPTTKKQPEDQPEKEKLEEPKELSEQMALESKPYLEIPKTDPGNLEEVPALFVIDFINRRIRMLPGIRIANSNTRKFLKLSPDFYINGTLEADGTLTTVAGTAPETTIASYIIPLNAISRNYEAGKTSGRDYRKAGNVFRIRAAGVYTTDDAVAIVTLRLKIGSTVYHALISPAGTISNAPWIIDWTVIALTIGSAGTVHSAASAKINNVNKDDVNGGVQAIDTTATQTISITAEWGSGSVGDSISIRQFIVELMN